jgi:hypothetical protein
VRPEFSLQETLSVSPGDIENEIIEREAAPGLCGDIFIFNL